VRQRNHAAKTKGFRGLEMNAIDSNEPTIDAPESSPFASSIPNRDELNVVNEYLTLAESQSRSPERSLFRFP